MRETKSFIWTSVGCAIFMIIGLVCWYALHSVAGLEHPYFIIALVNFIGFVGHGITNQLIRRFVDREPMKSMSEN